MKLKVEGTIQMFTNEKIKRIPKHTENPGQGKDSSEGSCQECCSQPIAELISDQ